MWGNSLGWGLSAAWTALVLGALFFLSSAVTTVSGPTDFFRTSGVAEMIQLPTDAASILSLDAGPADAASLYRQAIALYHADKATFDRFAGNAMKADPRQIEPAVALIRQAAGTGAVPIFASTPDEVVLYNMEKPNLDALVTLGTCSENLGLRTKLHDKEAAKKDYEAAMALGARLVNERVCYSELSGGLGLLTGGAAAMANLLREENDTVKADAFDAFSTSVQTYDQQKIIPVWNVISSIDQTILEAHAGDVFYAAQHSKEHMWRVEAALALGRYKFDAGRKGDNVGALKIATDLAKVDPDPAVKLAASLSRDLTLENRNQIH